MANVVAEERALWTRFYDREAQNCEMYSEPSQADTLYYRQFFERLPRPHRIVDLGCGYGRYVPFIKAMGIDGYLGIDFAEKQVARAKKLHPHHSFEVCDIFDVGERHKEEFHGFLLTQVLMCVPHDRLAECLRSIRLSLKTGAIGVCVTVGFGQRDMLHKRGMNIVYHDREEMRRAGNLAGFEYEKLEAPNDLCRFGVVGVLHAI